MRMHASGWLIRYGLLCRKSAVMLAEGCWGDCVRTYKPVITNGFYAARLKLMLLVSYPFLVGSGATQSPY
jgi:hypothetical protein